MLYWIYIRQLSRPLQQAKRLLFEPLLHHFCTINWSIILLKDKVFWVQLKVTNCWTKTNLQNFLIEDLIHFTINLHEERVAMNHYTPSYHDCSTTMFHYFLHMWTQLVITNPTLWLFIRIELVNFAFSWNNNPLLITHSPMLMLLCKSLVSSISLLMIIPLVSRLYIQSNHLHSLLDLPVGPSIPLQCYPDLPNSQTKHSPFLVLISTLSVYLQEDNANFVICFDPLNIRLRET